MVWVVWLAVTVLVIVLNIAYPLVILPLFYKLSPLPPSPLRTRIEALASSVGFRIGRLQVVDSSSRSGHSNAAAYGFFGVNGILLFDTLLSNCKEDEVVAVVAHELGHWKRGHTYRVWGVR